MGIGERVRLLGGQFDAGRRIGEPTLLGVDLLRWLPPDAR
jgi:hypothetical protein